MIKVDANQIAITAMQIAQPKIIDICPAREVIPLLEKMTLLHAGPPISWENMVDMQQCAVIGAILYEGWAVSPEEARKLASSGKIRLLPCNEVNAVGGLAGVTSPSMPVVVAASANDQYRAFCRLWEPYLVFGHYDQKTLSSLNWLEHHFAPALKMVVQQIGGIDINAIIASALQMGDDTHSRKTATSLLLNKAIMPGIIVMREKIDQSESVLDFLFKYDAVSLSFVIAAAKVMTMAASFIKDSSVITTICSNGYEIGIQISGTGNQWFTAPAPVIAGKINEGFTMHDAMRTIGDSAIAEVVGLGGCALAAAPKASSNVSGKLEEAVNFTLEAQKIAVSQHGQWKIPALDDMGTPLGLDIYQCLRTSISPPLAATIANVKAGHPPVGAGIARIPMDLISTAALQLVSHNHNEVV